MRQKALFCSNNTLLLVTRILSKSSDPIFFITAIIINAIVNSTSKSLKSNQRSTSPLMKLFTTSTINFNIFQLKVLFYFLLHIVGLIFSLYFHTFFLFLFVFFRYIFYVLFSILFYFLFIFCRHIPILIS